jgi:hypothetical protein
VLYGDLIPACVGEWLAAVPSTTDPKVREANQVKITKLVNYDLALSVPFVKYYMVVGASDRVSGYEPHPLFFWPQVWNQVDVK